MTTSLMVLATKVKQARIAIEVAKEEKEKAVQELIAEWSSSSLDVRETARREIRSAGMGRLVGWVERVAPHLHFGDEGMHAGHRAAGGIFHAMRTDILTVCGFPARAEKKLRWKDVDIGRRCGACHRITDE